jgi:6-phosphogluconolactonase
MPHPDRRTFLAASAAALAAPATAADPPADGYWAFFGTYTDGKSKGIYRSRFDPKAGTLSPPELAAPAPNPSFLAVHPTRKYLYAVAEVGGGGGRKGGGVTAFALDARAGTLAKINETDSGGPGPCHLTVDRTGKCLIVANYGGGSCGLIPIMGDGAVAKITAFHQHQGSGPYKGRQEGPHAHSANVSPDNRFVIVADLGLDRLLVYKLDPAAGTLAPNDPPYFACPPGSGPRHFAFHPSGKFAYTNGELDFTVAALRYDADKGRFEPVNVTPTIPADTPESVRKKNSTAEVAVHPSGRYVFVSNRGHNSIATFKVDPETGGLTAGPHLTGDVNTPRNFAVDPTGRWILVANQGGDSVVVFEWDNDAGNGKQTGTKVEVGKPVCVRFVPVSA